MLRFGVRCCVPNPDCLGRVVWLERGSTAVGGEMKPEMRRGFCALRRFGARCCVPNPDCLGRVVWLERGSTAVGGEMKPEMRRDFCALRRLFI
ncbi:hypothetical protein NDU88_007195 [Pleurodeles waltl]|uniref:Uncharacterized protein n=1 Tax=Pleurodeles waltl TaxID=8319 RepID=A0AAV7VSU2_PLEWA|nr:hypothetical protein NDU88_007195 [Pleurodeles waltl]